MSEELTICKASAKMLNKAQEEGISTAFERAKTMKPCPFGASGTCCKNCAMGPCRISTKGDKEGKGVCGATSETIAARNFIRMIAAGAAAHSDHGRDTAITFLSTAKGEIPGYEIKDEEKLHMIAQVYGISTAGKSKEKIAEEVGEKCLSEFGKQEGEIEFIKRAPVKRQTLWRENKIAPRGIDREIVEIMHRTHMGVDQDYKNILQIGSRAALSDGWGGSMIATELQDIMFGTPIPLRAKVNLGVLKEDEVNIIVHGHEPLLSEMIVAVAQNKEMIDYAKQKGAKGINIAGICCTANEILMRHGIPIAGNLLQQELAIVTGAVDGMIVDVQCIMQSLPEVASCYHTKVITTSKKAKIPGATHIEFSEHDPINTAAKIIKEAIENYPNRMEMRVNIPKEEIDLVAGFSHETVSYMLGGQFRKSYRPLNDAIIDGRIRGVVGVVGCNNPRVKHDYVHTTLVKELIAENVLVLQTGCAAIACAKEGLLIPEAKDLAGAGLKEICEAVGIPPVLHCGSCVDNSRLLIAATEMVKEGGLGNDISDLPIAGAAPEWMSEKAISIGHYFVASGVYVVFGVTFPITGSEKLAHLLYDEFEGLTGGSWAFEPDPIKQAELIIKHIDHKRELLGIAKRPARVLYDMAMRRELKF
ncbi:MAG: anaerobic carbon-monoxide dehydrogenase catalytic subunit [bacterium]